jgi:hypothetical protein
MAGSALFPVVQPHMSSIKLAKLFEKAFNMEQEEIILPFVSIAEQAEGQRLAQSMQEQTLQSMQTASGMGEDFDQESLSPPPPAEEQPS